jgi:hypothetical protein
MGGASRATVTMGDVGDMAALLKPICKINRANIEPSIMSLQVNLIGLHQLPKQ